MTEDSTSFFRKKGAAGLVADVLRYSLDDEEMSLNASVIFRNMAQDAEYTDEAVAVYNEIGFELIFQALSRYTENEEICENMLGMFDKRLSVYSKTVRDIKYRKSEETMLKEIEVLNRVAAMHKASRTIARGFVSFFKTFSFHIEHGKT